MAFDWTTVLVMSVICAGIGAAISNSNNRGVGEGIALGALLGIIGVIIAVCLKKQLPEAPAGMFATKCPRCNAIQNVPAGQPEYECWQCHTTSPSPSAALAAAPAELQRKVKCGNCSELLEVPFQDTTMTIKCPRCQMNLTIPAKQAPTQR